MITKIDTPLDACELKFAKDGVFEGYASVFNGTDSDGDTIHPGAYSKSIEAGNNPAMFINHNAFDIPVGRWTSLHEDDTGLIARGEIDMNHRDGPSLYSALKKGAMNGLSVGFRIFPDGFKNKKSGGRDIFNIDLKEISAVTFPADNDARVSVVKNEIQEIKTLKDAELLLRDSAGLSRSVATAFVSHLKGILHGERVDELTEENTKLKAQVKELERALGMHNSTEHLVRVIANL